MPILNWIGKDKVINHHQQAPYRVLEPQYTYGDGGGNMLIHGDNLDALKALLPRYEGRIKLVYIDPPYNTGNEGWVYNDNVNDPKIRKWLGEVVGREGEDLSRHDKWLCMVYPRLRLLQKLLADDGAIFISIDDTECMSLKFVCDEIFGTSCFVADISWQRTYSTRNDSKGIVREVEHILAYGKQPDWQLDKLPRTEKMNAKYKNPDNDVREWRSDNAFAPGAATHQGMVYAIQHPFTGAMLYPSNGSCWRYQQDMMLDIMRGWCDYELRDLQDAKERAKICGVPESEVRQGVMGIVLSQSLEESAIHAQKVYGRGQWPRFFFSKQGKGGIARKTYLENVGGKLVTNFWPHSETGHTDEAKKEMLAIFDGVTTFDTPKPVRLIQRILEICPDKDALVLDSFAGSGTTAHAVLNMNKRDGGNRRFILVEMEDYAESITAERVKRVIDGYGATENGRMASAPTGGGFAYYELGERLLLEDGNINENLDTEKIREYVWYTETRSEYAPQEEDYLLGVRANTAYYFYYDKGRVTVLDHDFLHGVRTRAGGYLIYADINTLSAEEMDAANIRFKKIPRDIARL
ncbi:MAG: site-specific DNA-methyltransferase [Oscillospiraceae bacterium]|jgi:adenine-specific DNA-methyltransferase|nr:site-specific DNA-methyltransferase [Oscillospiraceae bacterium]